jgi:hypothetical protein
MTQKEKSNQESFKVSGDEILNKVKAALAMNCTIIVEKKNNDEEK